MPWRRCSTSTTRANPANGCRISTAATKTSKLSTSSAAPTNWRIRSQACSRWPRSPRRFRAFMWAHPGKKLLFMGQEIGQREEWNHDRGIRWELLEFDPHRKLQALVRELNRLYRANPALYEVDFHYRGFEWVDFHDWESSTIAFLRRAEDPKDFLLFCCNFTPVPRTGYEFGVPEEGFYEEILNTD